MNKITLLLVTLLFTFTAIAQDSPGKRPTLLLNKTVKVKPLQKPVLTYQHGYDSFYRDENLLERYAENKSRKTEHDSLANRVLVVKEVEPFPLPGAKDYKIKLEDPDTKEVLFFKFNEAAATKGKYYFEVFGGLDYPAEFFCDYIEEVKNPATGTQTLTAVLTEGITVTKITRGGTTVYHMEIRSIEEIISMVPGVSLVLENGLQVARPDIQAEVSATSTDMLMYYVSFDLTPHEVSLLSQSKIVKGKISKFEKTFAEGEKLKQMMRCMGRR